jgi:queuine tRNA-ribosyltransferase
MVEAVRAGMDMFDCVLPTRNGRNAWAFTAGGRLKLRNAEHTSSDQPLEDGCQCYTCGKFSRGYLRHLFLAGEMLGPVLTSIHNLHFYQRLMARIRDLIPQGKLGTIRDEFPVVGTEEPKATASDAPAQRTGARGGRQHPWHRPPTGALDADNERVDR